MGCAFVFLHECTDTIQWLCAFPRKCIRASVEAPPVVRVFVANTRATWLRGPLNPVGRRGGLIDLVIGMLALATAEQCIVASIVTI
ncbi:DUF2958 domain-containing protein [Xanthomonas theicola]|uniref:DUF2958 domain-containing protein n=1 Tax=Xanthomonas theicola TaxID=56464 RepID=UPI000FF89AC2|nr:DUF2958 domain-containing protein [Xanthomonas theicola]